MNRKALIRSARPLIELALSEDLAFGDLSSDTLIPEDHQSLATIHAGEDMVVCGLPLVDAVFQGIDPGLKPGALLRDGSKVAAGDPVWELSAPTQTLLQGERTALNFLQMLSGIATMTSAFVSIVDRIGSKTRICDTRKTVPGYRLLSKYAVRCGGGFNHRFSLADVIMLKDNHLAVQGSIREAVTSLRGSAPHTSTIEVEADTLEQAREAVEAGADILLLDNMGPDEVRQAVEAWGKIVILEASGGMTLDTVEAYANTGVHVISIGALTHSAPATGFSLSMVALK